MECFHQIINHDSRKKLPIEKGSLDLIVTSPPYPMIEMWDESFSNQNKNIRSALKKGEGNTAFELMHFELNKVWKNIHQLVKEGGIVCINIGDATRTINGNFKLYSNHSKIISDFLKLGFSNLPNIIWRKQTNAPNKFLGSGMLAPGAYVTLEHEYILIFRKGRKREFNTKQEKENRNLSSYFWEERNIWFSDVWDFKGTSQKMNNGVRKRSGAFPFELAYRLINMFSVKGDTVFDPFLGLGTTTFASIASQRNSVGVELENGLVDEVHNNLNGKLVDELNDYLRKRIEKHLDFIETMKSKKGKDYFKYTNKNFDFPVMTKQELNLLINYVKQITKSKNKLISEYYNEPLLDSQVKLNITE